MLEDEPFVEILAWPSLGASQLEEVSQVVDHLLHEFHLLIQEVNLQKVSELSVCGADPEGVGSGSSPEPGQLPQLPGIYPAMASACPGTGPCIHAGFGSSRDVKHPSASPQPIHGRSGPCPPETHHSMVEIEAQREVG